MKTDPEAAQQIVRCLNDFLRAREMAQNAGTQTLKDDATEAEKKLTEAIVTALDGASTPGQSAIRFDRRGFPRRQPPPDFGRARREVHDPAPHRVPPRFGLTAQR